MTARTRRVPFWLLLIGVAIAPSAAIGQTAVVNADGDGVFRAPSATSIASADFLSMLTFKSDDTSVKLSFATPTQSGTAGQLTYGADISAKSSQGLAAILKSGTYTPGTKINGYALRHSLLTDVKSGNSVDWVVIQGSLAFAQQPLFDQAKPYAEQVTKPVFKGGGLKATYAYEYAGWLMMGATGGWERTSNYADLKTVTVSNQKTFTDPATGDIRAADTDQTSAKQGSAYVEGNIGLLRADAMFYPSSLAGGRLGITFYQNNRLSGDKALRRSDIGVGLALLKAGSPSTSIGAVVVELQDLANTKASTDSLGRRLTVNLQVSMSVAPKFGF